MPFIRDAKKRGEWVELQFMARAQSHGLNVLQPWGDSLQYDFIVEHNGRFHRVQVKSTSRHGECGYDCNTRHGQGLIYHAGKVDYFAVFVLPEDLWYIIPFRAIAKRGIRVNPRRPGSKYSRYMEAWHLLKTAAAVEVRRRRPAAVRKQSKSRGSAAA